MSGGYPSWRVRHANSPPKPRIAPPAPMSTACSTRGPTWRRATATRHASRLHHVRLPSATPAIRSALAASPSPATLAVEAAANTAAHDAIVSGFDAVAARLV